MNSLVFTKPTHQTCHYLHALISHKRLPMICTHRLEHVRAMCVHGMSMYMYITLLCVRILERECTKTRRTCIYNISYGYDTVYSYTVYDARNIRTTGSPVIVV